MGTRSLKAFVASLAVVIALLVAAVPANAKPGNGQGGGGGKGGSVSPPTYDWCPAGYYCVVFYLS
jgi:hypothetical protein